MTGGGVPGAFDPPPERPRPTAERPAGSAFAPFEAAEDRSRFRPTRRRSP